MRARTGIGSATLVALLLAGCTPAPPADDDAATPGPTPEVTETAPAETPTAREFRMPTFCDDLVTADTEAAFDADGLQLLGGPGGIYGENYFGDPTPEERAGGITCVWGDEDAPATTVIVSVAPVTASSRAGIVKSLVDSGLIESELEGALSYARIGDEVSAPGELHVIRNDSWISVIEAVGGEERFEHATELVDEVTAQVYVSG
jgi:hypothetical protein